MHINAVQGFDVICYTRWWPHQINPFFLKSILEIQYYLLHVFITSPLFLNTLSEKDTLQLKCNFLNFKICANILQSICIYLYTCVSFWDYCSLCHEVLYFITLFIISTIVTLKESWAFHFSVINSDMKMTLKEKL